MASNQRWWKDGVKVVGQVEEPPTGKGPRKGVPGRSSSAEKERTTLQEKGGTAGQT